MVKRKSKKNHLKPLSLYPLKAEEALVLFMQVDPAKVEARMHEFLPKRGRKRALSKG